MPSHYQYQCSACGKIETRYRNAQQSRCCHAKIVRLEGKPIDWEGDAANLLAQVERLHAENDRQRDLLRDALPIIEFAVKEYHVGPHPILQRINAALGR